MRESVLRELAGKAAADPAFLGRMRRDVKGTLDRYGYDLTAEELRIVEDLRRRTALVGDGTLAVMLASGLQGRSNTSPARPASPIRPGSDLSTPAPPDARRRRPGDADKT